METTAIQVATAETGVDQDNSVGNLDYRNILKKIERSFRDLSGIARHSGSPATIDEIDQLNLVADSIGLEWDRGNFQSLGALNRCLDLAEKMRSSVRRDHRILKFETTARDLIIKNLAAIETGATGRYDPEAQIPGLVTPSLECFRSISYLTVGTALPSDEETAHQAIDRIGIYLINQVANCDLRDSRKWFRVFAPLAGAARGYQGSERAGKTKALIDKLVDTCLERVDGDSRLAGLASSFFELNSGQFSTGEIFIARLLARYGYSEEESHEMLSAWRSSAPPGESVTFYADIFTENDRFPLPDAVRENVRNIIGLERLRPTKDTRIMSTTKSLTKKFGIHCFGRCSPEFWARQYDERESGRARGIILFSVDDQNGAQYAYRKIHDSIFTTLNKNGHLVQAIEVRNEKELARQWAELKQKGVKVPFVIVEPHGIDGKVVLDQRLEDGQTLGGSDFETKANLLGKFVAVFSDDPIIVFFSCYAGEENQVAQQFSRITGGRAIAAEGPHSVVFARVVTEKEKVDFEVVYNPQDSLRRYEKGVKVQESLTRN